MRIFGPTLSHTSFTTTATAQYLQARNCMLALPGGAGITINGNVNMPNCGVVDAQNLNGTGSLTAAAIGVSGTSSLTTTPNAVTGILQTQDPFVNMAAPNPGPGRGFLQIDNNNFPPRPPRRRGGQPIPQNVTVLPGSYTGISIAPTFLGNVTFAAGNYTIGASGLSLTGGAAASGNGVMFYLKNGGSVNSANSQKINLSAPTNGAYSGILFFQSQGNTAPATFTGAGGSGLNGGLYFPSATINLNGGVGGPTYLIVVAKTIHINTSFTTFNNYNSLANGSPIKAATLVQ